MDESASKDPLHGMTLKAILEDLVERYGWPELAEQIPIRCFLFDPTITSSLKFLRRTPWARSKVERIYEKDHRRMRRNAKRKRRAAAKQAYEEGLEASAEE